MAENTFGTTALLEIQLDSQSLDNAEDTIERRLGNAASVSAGGGGSGNGRRGLRRQARQLDQMLSQDETRNRLLEKLVRQGEDGDGDNPLRKLGSLGAIASLLTNPAALGLGGLAGLGLAASDLIDDVPDITPGDLVDDIPNITPDDLIGATASVGVGDLVGDAADVGSEAVLNTLVASGATLTAGQVLDHIAEGGSGQGAPRADSLERGASDPVEARRQARRAGQSGPTVPANAPGAGNLVTGRTDPSDFNFQAGAIAAGLATAGSTLVAGGSRLISGAGPTPSGAGLFISRRQFERADENLDRLPGTSPNGTASVLEQQRRARNRTSQRPEANVTVQNDVTLDASDSEQVRRQLREEVQREVVDAVMRQVEQQLSLQN